MSVLSVLSVLSVPDVADEPDAFELVLKPAGGFQPFVPVVLSWVPPPIPNGKCVPPLVPVGSLRDDPCKTELVDGAFGTAFFAGAGVAVAKHGELAATQTAQTSAKKQKKRISIPQSPNR